MKRTRIFDQHLHFWALIGLVLTYPVKIILQDSHKFLQDVQDIARWINLQEFWKFFLQVFFLLARLSPP